MTKHVHTISRCQEQEPLRLAIKDYLYSQSLKEDTGQIVSSLQINATWLFKKNLKEMTVLNI